MATNEFIILAGMIIVGFIFFLVAQGFISGELLSTKEKMYQTESQEIVSLIERSTSEQGPYFYYFREISFSNVSVKNKVLTYQKGSLKFLYPVPKEVEDSVLENVTSICVLKKTGDIKLLDKCPKCNMDSLCSQDECREDCPDCYGPNPICVGDGFCNKGIGENCESSIDCPCSGLCCPASPDSNSNGCSNIGNIERSKQCWCTSQCQSGLECNPTAPTFSSYPKACCDPHKGWDGTDCVNIECPESNKCPGAPMNGGNGDNAWTDINGFACCPFSDVGDISGPVCSSSHCCPTAKTKWCGRPASGSPRCMDETEYKAEKCSPTISCDSIKSPSDLPSSWDWRNVNGMNWMSPMRDQGQCGSCWAFSAVGTTEGTYNIEQGTPGANNDLSEQDLVSCKGTGGCSGDWEDHALNIIKSSGICNEACFPYQASNAACNRCGDWQNKLWKINNYAGVSTDFERKKALVCNGPLAIDLTFLPHAVTLVGYDDAKQEWVIKNSWGVINGVFHGIRHEKGYGYIPYGTIGGSFEVIGVIPPK